jgi:hypothetical protein
MSYFGAFVPREGEPIQEPAKEMPAKKMPGFFTETKTKTKTSPVDIPVPSAELYWTPSQLMPQTSSSSSSLPLIIGVAAVALLLFRS